MQQQLVSKSGWTEELNHCIDFIIILPVFSCRNFIKAGLHRLAAGRTDKKEHSGTELLSPGWGRAGQREAERRRRCRAGPSCPAPWCLGDSQPWPVPARQRCRYIYQQSLLCPAGTPCPSQWESRQETNCCCCLRSRVSPRAWAGAALSLSPPSRASPARHGHSCRSPEPARPHACAAMRFLCFLEGLSWNVRSDCYHIASPCSWIILQRIGLLGFQRVSDFVLYVTEITQGHDTMCCFEMQNTWLPSELMTVSSLRQLMVL